MVALRADHEVDHCRAGDDLGPFGLGDAAGHGDLGVEPLGAALFLHDAHAAKLRIDLLRRLFANVAGVEDDEVGLGHVVRRRIAGGTERLRHALGIVGIHLAAEGLDMQLFGAWGHACCCGTTAPFVKGGEFQAYPRLHTERQAGRVGPPQGPMISQSAGP